MSLGATVLIGAFVGTYATLTGSPVSQMSIETQLAANGAVIAVIQKVLTTLYRYLENTYVNEAFE